MLGNCYERAGICENSKRVDVRVIDLLVHTRPPRFKDEDFLMGVS